MSMTVGIVIMIVVLLIVGTGGYFAFNSVKPSPTTTSSCYPPTSVTCLALAPTHDVTLFTPFKSVQTNTTVPFTATLKETAKNYSFNFGDGSAPVTSINGLANHSYAEPGTYIVSVQANVGGTLHDNYLSLIVITVAASYSSASAGNAAPLAGAIVTNSTPSASVPPSAILQPGGSVTVHGAYTGQPTNPIFTLQAPKIIASSAGKIGANSSTSTNATATVAFPTSGIYWITYVGSAVSGTTTAYLNYTWTVFVAPAGVHASTGSAAAAVSPHPGSLVWYEEAPGGGRTQDPSLSYDSASGELVYNVYQTLISYNGTLAGPDPTDFVPTIAACVPGSGQCTGLFGTDLINQTTGAYTFVISSSQQFYDPGNPSAKWGVYPTDVLFTYYRTMAFADEPFVGSNPGWIISQGLLPYGNSGWDGGMHSPYNNTPQSEAASILVNSSQYCPSAALTNALYHGCVTFLANGGGTNWPFFLEFVADWEGGGIESCGWFSAAAQGAAIPMWTDGTNAQTKANEGDHPCLLPGGGKSTDDPSFAAWVHSTPATAWDSWEMAASTPPFIGHTTYSMVGSGPYYLADLSIGQNYLLKANPNYQQNPNCALPGCDPKVGGYASSVSVDWEATSTPGEQAIQAGAADHAGIPSTDVSTLIEYLQDGKVQAVTAPAISIDAFYYDMDFSLSAARALTTNPINVPSDFFSHVALREFLAHAYPYTTAELTVNTADGIQYGINYGGAIPQFMGNYYPTNVSWPSGNPPTTGAPVGSAQWWWQEGTTAGSPFYDPEMAACTPSNPCQFPFIGETGAPQLDQQIALLVNGANIASGGALKMSAVDISFDNLLGYVSSPPGQNALTVYRLGWAPDYPDPTDYIAPFYQPDQAYTSPDAVRESLEVTAYMQYTYPGGHCMVGTDGGFNASDVIGYAHMAESLNGIPSACQGWAYEAMNYQAGIAASLNPGPARVLAYNTLEQIANGLCLYIYFEQPNVVTSVAPWINPASINTNIMVLGGSEWDFFHITGSGVLG
jgi:hypothetical protein